MAHPFSRYIFQNQFVAGILLVVLGWFLFEIRDILVTIFIAYIIMAALFPFVSFFRRKKFPNVLAVLIPYLSTLAIVILLIFPLFPFIISQIQSLLVNFPVYFDTAAKIFGISVDQGQIQTLVSQEFDTLGRNAFSVTSKIFGGFFSTLTILVLSFYLLIDRERIKRDLIKLFPSNSQAKAKDMFRQIEEKLGAWLRGQLVLCFSIGLMTWIGLTAINLEYALPLALIAGILEVVPTIGPIISAIPAIVVALTISPPLAIVVAILYIIIQALENNVLVPKIMEKAVGFNPIIIILGIMIGGRLMGVIGALLSVPFIAMIAIVIASLRNEEIETTKSS